MKPYDRFGLDYFQLLKESRRADPSSCPRRVRLALLADCSTAQLVPALSVLLARNGIAAEIHESDFGAIRQQAASPDSALYRFKPDVVVILNSTLALRAAYNAAADRAAFGAATLSATTSTWTALRERCDAAILQSNFVLPAERLSGNYDLKADDSLAVLAARLNAELAEAARARSGVFVNDMDFLASYVGRRRWFDEKLWLMGKSYCALDCLPLAAQSLVDVTRALLGGAVKCVVVDLDNTLWGGVLGDDGLDAIRLGELADGEAFSRMQRYLADLKRRGILLAVCSRNDPETARRAFREHPEMVLREDDFAVFIANWESKADNIKKIRETLGIGYDAMVFLDDDPFERNLVSRCLPDVIVPELPEDPADYVKVLSELNLFETAALSEADEKRTRQYREQARREEAKTAFADTASYLQSLRMRAAFARFDSFRLPRVAQLISRSDQFNLTTKRYNEAQCERFMKDGACHPFYVTLKDDLGDSGLVSVVILLERADALEIDEWIMSCRALLRGLEEYTMNAVVDFARGKGFRRLVGRYVPSPKNAMVKDFYGRFGFQKSEEAADGSAAWTLDVAGYAARETFVSAEPPAPR